jgi:SET domain
MYCSKECQNQTYRISETIDDLVAKSPNKTKEKVKAIVRDIFNKVDGDNLVALCSDNHPKSIFDFDFSDPSNENYKMKLGLCLLGFNPKSTVKKHFMDHFSGVVAKNGNSMQYKQKQSESTLISHGAAYLIFGALLNHSCDPNVEKVDFDGKVAFIVIRPIKTNEQLLISYV